MNMGETTQKQTFDYLLPIFIRKPYLLSMGFESFLFDFSILSRSETLNNVMMEYRQKTLIPEVVSKDYEAAGLENISKDAAYFRCQSLLAIEGIINNLLLVQ